MSVYRSHCVVCDRYGALEPPHDGGICAACREQERDPLSLDPKSILAWAVICGLVALSVAWAVLQHPRPTP